MIAVIDYGLGNLKSVHKAFKLLGYESKITTNRKQILDSQAIVSVSYTHLTLPTSR